MYLIKQNNASVDLVFQFLGFLITYVFIQLFNTTNNYYVSVKVRESKVRLINEPYILYNFYLIIINPESCIH